MLSAVKKPEEDISAQAQKDAGILARIEEVPMSFSERAGIVLALRRCWTHVPQLKNKGLWCPKRIPKEPEPPRIKTHWDYLLEEMAWMANDFREERKWKIALARKLAKACAKRHRERVRCVPSASRELYSSLCDTRTYVSSMLRCVLCLFTLAQDATEKQKQKLEEIELRKKARDIARMVKRFWAQVRLSLSLFLSLYLYLYLSHAFQVEKLAIHRQQQKLEEKRKAMLDKHLDFLVGETERYTSMASLPSSRALCD